MRKRIYGRKLGRTKDAKRALLAGLVRSLVENEAIETSEARAKALKSFADKIVHVAKKDSLAARRTVEQRLRGDRETASKIFSQVLPKVSGKQSGFTRIVRLGTRRGDRSQRVRIEWAVTETQSSKRKAKNDDSKPKTG